MKEDQKIASWEHLPALKPWFEQCPGWENKAGLLQLLYFLFMLHKH